MDSQAVIDYWDRAVKELDAFPPQIVADTRAGTLSFSGWRDRKYGARVWWGDEDLPAVVVVAGVVTGWAPPRDGRTWVAMAPLTWSATGLPDPDGYCIREQALAIEQAGRVIEKLQKRPARLIVVADGLRAAAAMGVAVGDPERVVGLTFVEPTGFVHMTGGRVLIDGKEGAALAELVRGHPAWRPAMQAALGCFDLENLGAATKTPVAVVVGTDGGEDWLDDALRWWGWRCLNVNSKLPTLTAVLQARYFSALWADCSGDSAGATTKVASR